VSGYKSCRRSLVPCAGIDRVSTVHPPATACQPPSPRHAPLKTPQSRKKKHREVFLLGWFVDSLARSSDLNHCNRQRTQTLGT
jgi:hypothetical protein